LLSGGVINFFVFALTLVAWTMAISTSQMQGKYYEDGFACKHVHVSMGPGFVLTVIANGLALIILLQNLIGTGTLAGQGMKERMEGGETKIDQEAPPTAAGYRPTVVPMTRPPPTVQPVHA
jgi:hypothetical protein